MNMFNVIVNKNRALIVKTNVKKEKNNGMNGYRVVLSSGKGGFIPDKAIGVPCGINKVIHFLSYTEAANAIEKALSAPKPILLPLT